jgi:hypothetical protein
MAIIDLSGQNPISESFSIDQLTGILTLTLTGAGPTTLGQIKIEKVRLRAFAEALAELARTVSSDTDTRQRSRMIYNLQQKSSEVTFG